MDILIHCLQPTLTLNRHSLHYVSRLATEGKKLQIPGRLVYGKEDSRDTKIGLCEVRVVTIDRAEEYTDARYM